MSNTKNTSDKFSSIKSELESSKVRLTQIKTELNKFKSKSDVENKNEFLYLRDAELASYVDETGGIKFAEIDKPRIDYDPNPATCDADGKHKCLGLLLECSSTNRLIYSTNLSNLSWVNFHQISTVAEENILSPELKTSGNQVISIIDLPEDDFHLIRQRIFNGSKVDRTVSIFVKRVENAGTKDFAIWGLNGLQIAVFSRKDWSFISGKATHTNVEFYPHGWVRLSATYNYSNDDIYFGTSARKKSRYLGENKKQFYLYGPQLEDLSQATSYIPTNEKPRGRGGDIVGINNLFYNGYSTKLIHGHIDLTEQQIIALKSNSNQEKLWLVKSLADLSKQINRLTNIVADKSTSKELTSEISNRQESLETNLHKLGYNVERIVVLDVGAMGGINPIWNRAIEVGINAEFYMVEPDRQSFEDLYRSYPTLKCIPHALGNSNSEATIYLTSSRACSSLRKPNFALLNYYLVKSRFKVIKEEKINCYRYDYLVKHQNAPVPEFVKIDVQGFEYEVLEGFGEILNQVLAVELESHFYPIYQGQKLAVEVIQYLAKYGLVLRKIEPHGPFNGELVEANLFFTKRKNMISATAARKIDLWEFLFNIPQG
ncbi:MAG: FkbM family methyltransferase [Okeania sp. SIO2D1]|nr:FkbM family methyltransferase [Okeania sp. SIO2D1]